MPEHLDDRKKAEGWLYGYRQGPEPDVFMEQDEPGDCTDTMNCVNRFAMGQITDTAAFISETSTLMRMFVDQIQSLSIDRLIVIIQVGCGCYAGLRKTTRSICQQTGLL